MFLQTHLEKLLGNLRSKKNVKQIETSRLGRSGLVWHKRGILGDEQVTSRQVWADWGWFGIHKPCWGLELQGSLEIWELRIWKQWNKCKTSRQVWRGCSWSGIRGVRAWRCIGIPGDVKMRNNVEIHNRYLESLAVCGDLGSWQIDTVEEQSGRKCLVGSWTVGINLRCQGLTMLRMYLLGPYKSGRRPSSKVS